MGNILATVRQNRITATISRTGEVVPVQATVTANKVKNISDVTQPIDAVTESTLVWNSNTLTFTVRKLTALDVTEGITTPSSALIVDANSHISQISVTNFRIQTSGGSTDYIDTILNTITASASNNDLASAQAIKTYVDTAISGVTVSANVAVTDGTIQGVVISNLDSPIVVADGGTGKTSFTDDGIFYASNSSTLGFLNGSNGNILQISNNQPIFSSSIDGGSY